jgi:bacteriorhodopsin
MNITTIEQFQITSNFFSLTVAAMGAATAFLWLNRSAVSAPYRMAVTVSGLVTFIALYHYFKISVSWNEAYKIVDGALVATGTPFNDAYRYVDWILTVPLLIVELILVMRLGKAETVSKSVRLGILAALMIAFGYPGEVSADAGTRWMWWALAMIPFLWIVIELLGGLKSSIDKQPASARGLINGASYLLVLSWAFYPVVFVLPMLGVEGSTSATYVQVGYSIADIVAKAVFGVLIFAIAVKKSEAEAHA